MAKSSKHFTQLKETAYHEAGHAVAALSYRMALKSVTIEPGEDSLGITQYGRVPKSILTAIRLDEWSPRQRDFVQNSIIAGLAGQIAQARFRGTPPRYGMHSDNEKVVKLAEFFGSSSKAVDAYIQYCFCVAEDLVKARWSDIKAVAAALLERKTLKRQDVRDIMFQLAMLTTSRRKAPPAAQPE